MAEIKTKVNNASVSAFLGKVADTDRRKDCQTVLELMKEATKSEPRMWGSSIIGFGSYHYESASGRSGEWLIIGFSPRKTNLTLYIMPGFEPYAGLMKKLGKFKTGKSCLYIKTLADVDLKVLKTLLARSVKDMGSKRVA